MVEIKRNINKDQFITWNDVEFDSSNILSNQKGTKLLFPKYLKK